jgi:hypothetical protein
MIVQQSLDIGQEIISQNGILIRLFDQTKETFWWVIGFHFRLPKPFQNGQCNGISVGVGICVAGLGSISISIPQI